MKRLGLIFCLLVLAAIGRPQQSDFPKLTGPYLDQKPSGLVPAIFPPGILSRFSMLHGKLVFSPDGLEAFWTCNAAPFQSCWAGVLEKRDGRWVGVQQHFSFASDL
jgi:hypothetical protein